jgi:hypothetical protein
MRYAFALAAALALAGCQTSSNSYSSADESTGHLAHQFTEVVRTPTGTYPETDRFSFTEVFRETRGIGVHITSSRLCWELANDCVRADYDIDIPPYGTFRYETGLTTGAPETETYRERYEGTDYQGNPVVLTTIFRPSDYMK